MRDLVDSYRHVDDQIPTASVNGLDAALATISPPVILNVVNAGTYTLPASKLLYLMIVTTEASGNVKIGSSVGQGEYFDNIVEPSAPALYREDIYKSTVTTIYFTGNFSIKIYTV